MSDDQHEHNVKREHSLRWHGNGAAPGTLLTSLPSGSWLGTRRSSLCVAGCVFFTCCFLCLWSTKLLMLDKIAGTFINQEFLAYHLLFVIVKRKTIALLVSLENSTKPVDLITNVRNVSARWCFQCQVINHVQGEPIMILREHIPVALCNLFQPILSFASHCMSKLFLVSIPWSRS